MTDTTVRSRTKTEGRFCKGCGQFFRVNPQERNKRVWCSETCRVNAYRRWRRLQPERIERDPFEGRTCRECSAVFDAEVFNQVYCSANCREAVAARKSAPVVLECRSCGTSWSRERKRGRKPVNCPPCADALAREEKAREEYKGQYCHGECGTWLAKRPRERNRRKWCSESCRTAKYYLDNPDKYEEQLERGREYAAAKHVPVQHDRTCPVCKIDFVANRADKVYCSIPCQSRARLLRIKHTEEYKERRRRTAYRRRALAGAQFTVFERTQVYERDGWICQLCLRPTNRAFTYGDPWSPTLDHIVPLADGGDHTLENCQLAHHLCNSVKSDKEFDLSVLAELERRYDPCPV